MVQDTYHDKERQSTTNSDSVENPFQKEMWCLQRMSTKPLEHGLSNKLKHIQTWSFYTFWSKTDLFYTQLKHTNAATINNVGDILLSSCLNRKKKPKDMTNLTLKKRYVRFVRSLCSYQPLVKLVLLSWDHEIT